MILVDSVERVFSNEAVSEDSPYQEHVNGCIKALLRRSLTLHGQKATILIKVTAWEGPGIQKKTTEGKTGM